MQLVFFACSDIRLSFSNTFSDKVMNAFSWLCFFALMSLSITIFPLIYSAYGKKARYFSINLHRPFKKLTILYFTI